MVDCSSARTDEAGSACCENRHRAGGCPRLALHPWLGWAHGNTPATHSRTARASALAKAAEARTARAEVKNKLKIGSLSLAEALASTETTIGKLKVVSLLESLPGVGKVKARKIMDEIGIADNRRVQGLGQQQKASLLDQLGK